MAHRIADSTLQELTLYKERLKALHEKWKPSEHQAEVISAMFSKGYKRIFIRGGRKSAKTETVLYCGARVAVKGRNKVISIIAPELKQQKKIVWNNRRLQDFFPPIWEPQVKEEDKRILFPWGSYIEIDGSDNEESHRGEEQDLLVLDELKDHKTDSYNSLYPNLAARDGSLIVIGSPPRNKKNLFYHLEQAAKKDPSWKFFHWTSWDNPLISREWLNMEKAAYYARGDGDIWESEYEANYVFGGKKAVFAVFNPDKHVVPLSVINAIIEKDRNKLEYFIVSDPGNRAAHANLFIAYNRYNNHIYILDEVYETIVSETATGKIYPRIQEKIKKHFPQGKVTYWIYDEAALWFANEVQAQFPDSPPMCPTNKAAKDKETSMGVIKDCMLAGKYLQSELCKNLEEEITGYYVDENDRYIKQFDHTIDCLRYFFDFIGYSYQMQPQERELNEEEKFLAKYEIREEEVRTSLTAPDGLLEEHEYGEEYLWN